MLQDIMTRVPIALLDFAGSACVIVSLLFLFRKHRGYWHFSNLSLLPYFLLFLSTTQLMLAGLQVSYLIFGIHGWYLWRLEERRDRDGEAFNEGVWYNLGWVLTLSIFAYTVTLSDFSSGWTQLQFLVTGLSLIANLATTRRWVWSWYVWILVNLLQSLLFFHLQLWAQVGLQGVLAAMSVYGLVTWRNEEALGRV